jgi:ABC-type Fe3+/spermidine/putrescine transport system ATPase subunit
MKVELKGISVEYIDWQMKNISFTVNSGEFVTLLGPSGCGKTSILKVISGIIKHSGGTVLFDGENISDVPPEKRGIGYVFQNDSLFPHMNVFENVAFGLRVRKAGNVNEKVNKSLSLVHLEGYGNKHVNELSGGEARRVAIARALAIQPKILLLDEPMNGLDAKLREKLKQLLKEIRSKLGTTTIFVTHDLDEAFYLSDRIVVMNNAAIEQIGTPFEILSKPSTKFVEDFISDYSLVGVQVKKTENKSILSGNFSVDVGNASAGEGFINLKKNNFRIFKSGGRD